MAGETLDDIVEELADKFGIYGCDPNAEFDDDHQPECKCRICYTIGMKERIIDAVKIEVREEILRIERDRIADFLIAKYGNCNKGASRTAMYSVAKDLAIDLTLRNAELLP